MKTFIKITLTVLMLFASLILSAQSKGEMPFSSSSAEARKHLRDAWNTLMIETKIEDSKDMVMQARTKDPDFALAYLFSFEGPEADKANVEKALTLKTSADEKLLLEGVKSVMEKKAIDNYLNPLLKKYPNDLALNLMIAYNYLQADNAKRAIEILLGLTKRNKELASAYNLLGYAYMEEKDMAKAEINFDKYIALRADFANPYDSKADYLMRIGKFEEAASLYENAFSMDPKNMAVSKSKAAYALARAKYPPLSEQDEKAIKSLSKSLGETVISGHVADAMKLYADQAIELTGGLMANVGLPNIRQRWIDFYSINKISKFSTTEQFIDGVGHIAVMWSKIDQAGRSNQAQEDAEAKAYFVQMLRKQQDGSWKILLSHWQYPSEEAQALTADDLTSIRQVLNKWETASKKGTEMTAQTAEKFLSTYAAQAVEIFPNQRSNIGIENIRTRLMGFNGSVFESNSLRTIDITGIGRTAFAWGIMDQSFYYRGSTELSKFIAPWVMLLSKDKDDAWKIVAIHWYFDRA